MGVYSLEEIIRRWQQGDLTAEQAIGQLLQLVRELEARLAELERSVYSAAAQPQRPRR